MLFIYTKPMNAYLYQYILATPILVLHGILALLILFLIFKPQTKLARHIKKYSIGYGLFIAIAAMVGSLGFSEGFNYEPCELCWIQRIFHYPQILLFALALKLKDPKVWVYSLWLSILGFIVSVYQIMIQFSPTLAASSICNINPSTASCSEVLTQSYGYITIPVMSATVFATLIVLYIYQRKTI